MNGNDTVSMLKTLDVNGPGQGGKKAMGDEQESPSEREVALHTMLQHSTQEASAEFLLKGGALETLLNVALENDTQEALLALKALTNLAALPSSRKHMMDTVIASMLTVGSRNEKQGRSAEVKVQALRCVANLATSGDAKPGLASSGAIGILLDVISGSSDGAAGTAAEVEWRVAALKIVQQLCSDADFRAEMEHRGIEGKLVDCLQEEPSKQDLKINVLQLYNSIILVRDMNRPLAENTLEALLKLLHASQNSSEGILEDLLGAFLLLSRQPGVKNQLINGGVLHVLASMGVSNEEAAAKRVHSCMDILMNLSAVHDAEDKFLESGVMDMLLNFITNNKSGSPSMVFAVSIVMNTCAGEDPVKQMLLEKGVVDSLAPLVKPATETDPDTWPALCLQATKAMMNLSVGKGISPHITAKVRMADLAALASRPCSPDQRLGALRLISNLCAENITAREEAASPGVLRALLDAMQLPPGGGAMSETEQNCLLEASRGLLVLAITESCRAGLQAARVLERLGAWLVVTASGREGAEAQETVVMVMSMLLSAPEAARRLAMILDSDAEPDVVYPGVSFAALCLRLEELAGDGGGYGPSTAALARECVAKITAGMAATAVSPHAPAHEQAPPQTRAAAAPAFAARVASDELTGAAASSDEATRIAVSSDEAARVEPAAPVPSQQAAAPKEEEEAGEKRDSVATAAGAGGAAAGRAGDGGGGAQAGGGQSVEAGAKEEAGGGGAATGGEGAKGGDASTMSVGIPTARQVPFDEIVNRTEGFAAQYQIGRGRGWGAFAVMDLENMTPCAVKPLGRPEVGAEVERLAEQASELGPCRHENVVPLLGTSLQEGEHQDKICCVLTPIAVGGSLALRMNPLPQSELPPCLTHALQGGRLGWADTLRILVQAGRGLAFLHAPDTETGKPGFLHGSVNPANILLDEYLNGRLADAFLGRFNSADATMHVSRQPMGFLDPAFARAGVYDTTTDGYGWGMTMLVALTGQNAMDSEWAEPDLVDRCDDALFGGDVARCLALADAQVGWPEPVILCMVQVIAGLLHRRKAARISVPEACRRLQEMMVSLGIPWGLRLPENARVCGFCLGASNVRFGCGHIVCCTNCIGGLVRSSTPLVCPVCQELVKTIGVIQSQ